MNRFDLHTHTDFSDGDDSPRELVIKAKSQGLSLVAITDHDTVGGVAEAAAAGREHGVAIVAGVEFSTKYTSELHILGLGVDAEHPDMLEAMRENAVRRAERIGETLERLRAAQINVDALVEYGRGATTRLAIAEALVEAGLAVSASDAFKRFLDQGAPGYVPSRRMERDRAIELIHSAGGLAVIAHPYQAEKAPRRLIFSLSEMGLDGIEVYYPRTSDGQRRELLPLAHQLKLLVTCGSDCHGASRPDKLGCTWIDTPDIRETYNIIKHAKVE